jgi:hypothetical protein
VSTPMTPSTVSARMDMRLLLREAAVVGVGLGGVTARHNCDGSQPHGWTGCYQASEVGQADAGTTADGSVPRQPVRVPVALRVMPAVPVSSLPAVLPDRLPRYSQLH